MPYIKPGELDQFTPFEARQYIEAATQRDKDIIEQFWKMFRWQTYLLVNIHLPKGKQIKDYKDMLILASEAAESETKQNMSKAEMDQYFENPDIKRMNDYWDEIERQKKLDKTKNLEDAK